MSAEPLKARAIIRLSATEASEDVREFLQGLITNDVSGELPVYSALLSAQGKTMFDFLVWADGADVLLDCEEAICADLIKRATFRVAQTSDIASCASRCSIPLAAVRFSSRLEAVPSSLKGQFMPSGRNARVSRTTSRRSHRELPDFHSCS